MTHQPLPASVRRGYALGGVATGTFGTVPGLLLLPYLTDTLGIGAALAGLLVLAPKTWDVVLNPIAGRLSDRHRSPKGPRRPFLLAGGLSLAACFALLFAGPVAPKVTAAAWVAVLFVACASAYSFFQVPYVAMPAEITDDYSERTRLMTWRVSLLALTILVTGAGAPAIRDAVGGRDGYRVMGVVTALLIVAGTFGAYFGTRRAPIGRPAATTGSFAQQLATVGSNTDFRNLLATFMIQALAIGAMLAGVDYVARHVLATPGASTILFVCFIGPALAFTPVWQRVGSRIGKRRGYLVSTLVMAAAAAALLAARLLPPTAVWGLAAVAGIGYAGLQMFPMAMMPDVAAVDAAHTGHSRSGLFTGVWTAGETLGLALGPGLYGAVLAVGGYRSAVGDLHPAQTDAARWAITAGFSIVPAVLLVASLAFLGGYRIEEADVTAALAAESPDEGA